MVNRFEKYTKIYLDYFLLFLPYLSFLDLYRVPSEKNKYNTSHLLHESAKKRRLCGIYNEVYFI